MSPETIEKIRIANTGRHHTKETKKKLSIKYKERRHNFIKEVYQYDLEGTFIKRWESSMDAAIEMNIENTGISHCVKGRKLTYAGYLWVECLDDPILEDKVKKCNKHVKDGSLQRSEDSKPMKVYQYDKQGNFVKLWNSVGEAQRSFDRPRDRSISACARGKRMSFRGYVWSYEKLSEQDILDRARKSRNRRTIK